MTKPSNAGAPLMIYPRLRVKLATLDKDPYVLIWKIWMYCQDAGNGGRFHIDELAGACDRLLTPAQIRKAIAVLERPTIEHTDGTTSPLWLSIADDHVQLPAWFVELNPGPEVWTDDVLRWRRARNKELHSPKCEQLREKVRKRDRHLCRYCGQRVKWGANNADHGATYDHVDPDEDNTLSNVVVACRRCNGRKKDRTPEQWIAEDPAQGLSLLPAGTLAQDAERVRSARDGPPAGSNPGSTEIEPGSVPSSRSRARPSRVGSGSNPNRTGSGPASSRPGAADHPPPPDEPPFDADFHREGAP